MKDFRFISQIPYNKKAKVEFSRNGEDTPDCTFECGERCGITLRLSRSLAALGIEAVFFNEYQSLSGKSFSGSWQGTDNGCDSFYFDLSALTTAPALHFFYIRVKTPIGILYVKKWGEAYVTDSPKICDLFQITVSSFEYEKPKKLYGGVIYHIFVDRFCRGGDVPISDGAELISGEWKKIPEYPEYPGAPLKNNTFYGGTLYGVADKLDYIKSLGVSVIYLSPVFRAASNHKYDTADYMTVDEMFGGDEALTKLTEKAKEKGISIILDGVFNHTGDDSIYFNKYSRFDSVGAYNSKESPYFSWYDFKEYPNKYTSWWDIPILPRINPSIPECGEYIAGEGGVIDKYCKMGVYGFRLDVADELSDDFISKIKSRLSEDGESMLYGEVWEDASNKVAYDVRKKYYQGKELDGVMNYPLRVGLIDYIVNGKTDNLRYAITDIIYNAPRRIRNAQMNLLGSHDTVRSLTALSGIGAEGKTNKELSVAKLKKSDRELAKSRLMSAYTALATLPGVPAIFYGDEVGLEGYSDPFCRMPYPWGNEDRDILSHYRKVGNIRKNNPDFAEGDYELLHLCEDCLIFARYGNTYTYITVLNNSKKALKLSSSSFVTNLFTDKRAKKFTLPSYSSVIFKAKDDTAIEIISEE